MNFMRLITYIYIQAGLTRAVFLINIAQIEQREFAFKALYFLGMRGLTALSYIVYD